MVSISRSAEQLEEIDDMFLTYEESRKYRIILGSLLYVSVRTEPNKAVAASTLRSFVADPEIVHLMVAKMTLRSLRRTMQYTLTLRPGNKSSLTLYADANWGGEAGSNRKSRTDIVILYGKTQVYITSCNQKAILLGSLEA